MSGFIKSYFGLFVSIYDGDNDLDATLSLRVDYFTPNGERRMCNIKALGRRVIKPNQINLAHFDISIDIDYSKGDVIDLYYGAENVGHFKVFYPDENNVVT